ncbi:MAG TPA: lipocalin-like domain-containing protein [Bryobacteraceae bacterium]|jgi:hypothetical protein|nr:lipocalin-like domain-containing protein [Bryobacteraceae bacterium]
MRLIAALLLVAAMGSGKTPNRLTGSWKLVSFSDTSDKGMPYFPFGVHPNGEFIFTSNGHFSAQAISAPTGPLPDALPSKGFDDMRFAGMTVPYLGYFGTYQADLTAGTLTLHLAGASAPIYVRSDVTRMIRFDGDRLLISGKAVRSDGRQWSWERILVRDK